MRSDLLRLAALLGFAALLQGCGQKGPLYLPEKTGNVVTRTGDATTPAPPEAAPAPSGTPNSTTADSSSKEENKKPK